MRIASPSMRIGSNAWLARRWSVGGRLALDHLFGRTNGVNVAKLFEAADDERLEKHERHFLRQTALMQLEFRADDDDGAAGIIDALAEEILAEASALALEHIAQRFEGAIASARDGTAMAAIVEQRIDGFLQHALFIANDDFGCLQLKQVAQAVVAINDAAIKIVQI